MKKISKITLILFIVSFIFMYMPLLFVVINSFNDSEVIGIWTKFSFKWFNRLFHNTDILKAAFTSIKIAIISATISTFLGFLAASLTADKNSKHITNKIVKRSIMLPSMMPEIIIGSSLLMLFIYTNKYFGWPKRNGSTTIIIGHIVSTITYAHITIRSILNNFDKTIEEAAINLGTTPIKTLFKIKLPIIMPAIISCWIFVFTLSLDDLMIASFLSGPGSTTITMLIFSSLRTGASPIINAFSTIFILLIALILVANVYITQKKKNK